MKSYKFSVSGLFLILLICIAGCKSKHIETRTYTANSPIYLDYEVMRNAVKMESSREIEKPGKIYTYENYLFVNDQLKGIHIIDNTNPESPVKTGFINIPGNIDIAVKGSVLYADSYTDLVAIDISDINNIRVTKRITDAFPYTVPEYDPNYPMSHVDPEKGVVVDWEVKDITETCENEDCNQYYTQYPVNTFTTSSSQPNAVATDNMSVNKSESGVGGSLARFIIYQDYLYALVDASSMKIFNVSAANQPSFSSSLEDIGWGLETLLNYGENMFIGSETGMFIYSLSSPSSPQYISDFNHARGCDPVVVDDDHAYVTVRSGTGCGGWTDELDVIDISDIYNPTLVNSFDMDEPHGMGIDGESNILFLCDGNSGIKVYDTSDPSSTGYNMLTQITGKSSIDAIAGGGHLIMVGEDGYYQYDYSDIQNIRELGVIAF